MDVFDAIRSNRSVRQFAADAISREDIERIVDAGRRSGSARNWQPWTYVIVTDREKLQQLSNCGPWCTHLAGAAFGVVLVTDDLQDPPTLSKPFDLGRTSQNMILAAWALGIASCMATIYEPDVARAALGIPADKAVPWAISFGYPHPDVDPRKRSAIKGGRQELGEVVRWEQWS
ncbi:MAG: hypothetical protein GYB65_05620 [Chloroflexi bacterium]|nr:hypothetical protein [Chloroflexota bacterium]